MDAPTPPPADRPGTLHGLAVASVILVPISLVLPFFVDWRNNLIFGTVHPGLWAALLLSGPVFLPTTAAGVLWFCGLVSMRRSAERGLNFAVPALVLGLFQFVLLRPARLLGGYYVMVAGLAAFAVGCWVRTRPVGAKGVRAARLGAWAVVAVAAGYAVFDRTHPPLLVMFDFSHDGAETLHLGYSDLTGRHAARIGTREKVPQMPGVSCWGRTVTFSCLREGRPAPFKLLLRVDSKPFQEMTFTVPPELTTLRVEVRDGVVSHTIE